LILSVAAASVLVFTSLQVSDSMRALNRAAAAAEIGNSDIIIEPKDDPNALSAVDPAPLAGFSGSFEYVLAPFRCHVLYEPTVEAQEYFSVWGVSPKRYFGICRALLFGSLTGKLGEDEVIISARQPRDSDSRKVVSIVLNVHAHPGTYRIAGLAKSDGVFANGNVVPVMIMSKARLDDIFETGGVPNMLYLKLVRPAEKEEMITALAALYPGAIVSASEESSLAGNSGADSSVSFLIVSLFAILVSAFIIHTSYRVIMSERLPVIGTFRSVGAAGRRMAGIYLLESAVIGLLGGVLGVLLGIPASAQVLTLNVAGKIAESNSVSGIRPVFVLSTIVFAALLTVCGAAIPIIGSSRRSLRGILLGEDRADRRAKPLPAIIGAFLVLGGTLASRALPGDVCRLSSELHYYDGYFSPVSFS
jgi:putative ABC transport system permease protein